ncbi:MAG: ABC transporter permease subunit, partial [Candidatus Entotheonellia bacterium]
MVLLQLLISGVLLGGIYALAAFGLALIFGVSNILNLAHGEFLMLGALACFLLGEMFDMNPFLSLPIV